MMEGLGLALVFLSVVYTYIVVPMFICRSRAVRNIPPKDIFEGTRLSRDFQG
jgi:hypothetical protein